jgi:hypothetical protein
MHAVTTSVAQIEFAASQNRQEVTKLDGKETDELLEIRLCTEAGANLLMYRLTVVARLIRTNPLLAPGNHEVKHRPMTATHRMVKITLLQIAGAARFTVDRHNFSPWFE